jgi:hypothetical protein
MAGDRWRIGSGFDGLTVVAADAAGPADRQTALRPSLATSAVDRLLPLGPATPSDAMRALKAIAAWLDPGHMSTPGRGPADWKQMLLREIRNGALLLVPQRILGWPPALLQHKPPVGSDPAPAEDSQPSFNASLNVPAVMAPGAEQIDIRYSFDDPNKVGQSATIEIFAHGTDACILKRPVPDDDIAAGEGTLEWDGAVDGGGDDFPDGFATLRRSPYRVRLTANGGGRKIEREQTVAVEVAELKVALEPASCLQNQGDRDIHAQVHALPGNHALNLEGNVFAVRAANSGGSVELLGNTDVGHREYAALWDAGAGPRIPIFVTVLLRTSDGRKVVAGKALGNAQIMWDYTTPTSVPPGSPPSGPNKTYLDGAAAYGADTSRPKGGSNAAAQIGGKRANAALGARAVLAAPDSGVTNFPFTLGAGSKRFWAAFASIEKDGPREGQAGVIFRPSITAGDLYTLRCYLDVERTLDADADIPATTPSADVGSFAVWRRVTLARRYRKCADVDDIVPDPRPYYNPAFIQFNDQLRTNAHVMTKSEYEFFFPQAVTRAKVNAGVADAITQYALPDGVSQYNYAGSGFGRFIDSVVSFFGGTPGPTTWVATFRSWSDFVDAAAKGNGLSHDAMVKNLDAKKVSEKNYAWLTERFAVRIAVEIATLVSRDDGITVVQFEDVHSLQGELNWRVVGVAAASIGKRHQTAFVSFADGASTFAHEVGHCLFLPHAPSQPGTPIENVVVYRHVGAITNCLMAYGNTAGLCALCLLRLRGCDGDALGPNGVSVPAPPPPPPPPPPGSAPILD